jgi:Protein of unknown function (DUF2783)
MKSGSQPSAQRSFQLNTNIQLPDDFYAALVDAHEGLTEQASFELNARILFLLANQIGDVQTLLKCVEVARVVSER